MNRPTRYRQRRQPTPADVAASLRVQAPGDVGIPVSGPGPDDGVAARSEALEGGRDAERTALLERIVNARVPSRKLCLLLVEVEGLSVFTDRALRRMVGVLDVIEGADGGEGDKAG